MQQEIGTTEAGAILGIDPMTVAHHAVAVDINDRRAVRSALKASKLPARKVGMVWLFRPEHVQLFSQVKRSAGRPPKRQDAA